MMSRRSSRPCSRQARERRGCRGVPSSRRSQRGGKARSPARRRMCPRVCAARGASGFSLDVTLAVCCRGAGAGKGKRARDNDEDDDADYGDGQNFSQQPSQVALPAVLHVSLNAAFRLRALLSMACLGRMRLRARRPAAPLAVLDCTLPLVRVRRGSPTRNRSARFACRRKRSARGSTFSKVLANVPLQVSVLGL